MQRALNSILSQDIENLEIVIVDDSKEDLTEKISSIISSLLKSSCSFKVFRNDGPHSAARARNLGVNKASGRYITFLDDDDIYLPGRLKRMLKIALDGKFSMVSSGRFYESGDLESIFPYKNQKFGVISIDDIKYHNDIDIGFMITKSRFEELGGFNVELKSLEDWDFIIRHLLSGSCYKIKRFDYAVNIELGKTRVSNNDSISYTELAHLHKNSFGDAWFDYMKAYSQSLSKKFNFFDFILLFSRTFRYEYLYLFLRQFK
ncbi:hypothetical protein WH43_10500 [Rheinheimera sp. KL1]|nr:hypothetical protein WH43_10500 [Rheinheimera sp. KL1]